MQTPDRLTNCQDQFYRLRLLWHVRGDTPGALPDQLDPSVVYCSDQPSGYTIDPVLARFASVGNQVVVTVESVWPTMEIGAVLVASNNVACSAPLVVPEAATANDGSVATASDDDDVCQMIKPAPKAAATAAAITGLRKRAMCTTLDHPPSQHRPNEGQARQQFG
ncbi:MAG: hypothetical protein ACKN9D_01925 [Actinomycetales bacterium]